MIDNYKYLSPFKILISFHKLIETLQEIALSSIDYRSNYAKALLSQIEDKPEFIRGIDNLKIIDDNQELIKNLLADLFPTALTENEIKAVTLPFYDITFNYTERFKRLIKDVDISIDMNIRDMDEHQQILMKIWLLT